MYELCFFVFFFKLIYLFIYGCVGASFLCEGFLQLWRTGATLRRGARASHHHGLSCCGAQAPDAQAQSLWLTGPVAPRHVGSSQTRARTRVPCIGRRTLNHCATREAPALIFSGRYHSLDSPFLPMRDLKSVFQSDVAPLDGQRCPLPLKPFIFLNLIIMGKCGSLWSKFHFISQYELQAHQSF